jgi:hypothetical protein
VTHYPPPTTYRRDTFRIPLDEVELEAVTLDGRSVTHELDNERSIVIDTLKSA